MRFSANSFPKEKTMRASHKFRLLAAILAGAALLPAGKSAAQEYCPITGARIGLGNQSPNMFGPAPQARSAPPANVVPHANAAPPRNAPPHANVTPPRNVIPHANAAPAPPKNINHAAVPKNTVPKNTVPKNTVPSSRQPGDHLAPSSGHGPAAARSVARVKPRQNTPLSQSVVHLTPQNVQEMVRQLNQQQSALLHNLSQRIGGGAAGGPSQEAAQQAIGRLSDHINSGNASGKDFADLVGGLQHALPQAAQPAALAEAGRLAVNQQVANWLQGQPAAAASFAGGGISNLAMVGGTPASAAGNNLGADNPSGGAGNLLGNPGTGGALGASNIAAGPAGSTAGTGISNPGNPGTGGALGTSNTLGGAGATAGTGFSDPGGGGVLKGSGTSIASGGGALGTSNPGGGGVLKGSGASNPSMGGGTGVANPGMGGAGNAFGGTGRWAGGGRWGRLGRWGGGNVPLGLIPGLPAGLMMPMGGGFGNAMLVGMGQPGDQIVLGTGDPDQAAGLAVAPPDALPAPASAGPTADGDVILANAASGPVSYNVNQNPFNMQPRDKQTLPAGTSWLVEFDRGNGGGNARYQLSPGYYEFRSGASGWDLFQKNFQTTLDNSGSPTPFSYVVDNQPQTLGPGQSQDLSGIYPPVVRFEDGAGQIKQRSLDGPAYRVALSNDRTLDVYPADAVASASSAGQPGQPVAASPEGTNAAASAPPGMNLPPGFKLFDPVAALTNPQTAQSLPPAFDLFRAAASGLGHSRTEPPYRQGSAVDGLTLVTNNRPIPPLPGPPAPLGAPVAARGGNAAEIPDWGTVIDPDGDCTIRQADGKLTIQLPATPHDLWYGEKNEKTRFNAPRVLREIEGDFIATVKVTADWNEIPASGGYHGAGLLVWDSEKQYLRLERNRFINPKAGSHFLTFTSALYDLNNRRPFFRSSREEFFQGRSTWLKLGRSGDLVWTSISHDGHNWIETGQFPTEFPKRVQLGVEAVNGVAREFLVEFESFTVRQLGAATSDSQQLQGTWVCTATAKEGNEIQDFVGVRALIKDDELTWFFPQPDGTYRRQQAKFRIDPTQRPKHFDWWADDKPDAADLRIYSLAADELRWATNLDRKTRPATFEAGLWQFTMKRAAPESK
jgi:uncharacterized protein (TIGR03067 family)